VLQGRPQAYIKALHSPTRLPQSCPCKHFDEGPVGGELFLPPPIQCEVIFEVSLELEHWPCRWLVALLRGVRRFFRWSCQGLVHEFAVGFIHIVQVEGEDHRIGVVGQRGAFEILEFLVCGESWHS
jgi:hypothetical protein